MTNQVLIQPLLHCLTTKLSQRSYERMPDCTDQCISLRLPGRLFLLVVSGSRRLFVTTPPKSNATAHHHHHHYCYHHHQHIIKSAVHFLMSTSSPSAVMFSWQQHKMGGRNDCGIVGENVWQWIFWENAWGIVCGRMPGEYPRETTRSPCRITSLYDLWHHG